VVVVLPFEGAPGADPAAAAALRLRFVDALEALPDVRAIDGAALLAPGRAWRGVPAGELRERAERLGGGYFAAGTVTPRAGAVEVRVDLYSVADGRRLVQGSATAPASDAESAVGRVALQVIREVAGREGLATDSRRVLLAATSSAHALGHLVQGQRRFRDADHEAAAAEFRRAIEADSNCALAYHRLSVALVWRHDFPAALRAAEAGLARRGRVAPEWAQLLEAQRHYVRRDGAAAITLFQRTVHDSPGNADGWFGLGEALFHYGWFTGHASADAERAFGSLVQLDSAFAPVDDHVFDLALYRGDPRAAARALARLRGDDAQRPPRAAVLALKFGGPAARAAALRGLSGASRYTLSEMVAVLWLNAFDVALADTVATFLAAPGRSPDDRLRAAEYRLAAGAALGGWPERLAAWERVAADTAFDGWLAHAHFAGRDDRGRGGRMVARARALLAAGRTPDFSRPYWDEPRDAFLLLAHRAVLGGDSADVHALRRTLNATRERGDSSDPVPPAVRASLAARLALLAGDSARAIALLEDGLARIDEPFATFFPLRAMAPERMLLLELHAATRGDPAAARRWANSFTASRSPADLLFADRARRVRTRAAAQRAPAVGN
jgi:tetratricopeptide (TPR) repeat protein